MGVVKKSLRLAAALLLWGGVCLVVGGVVINLIVHEVAKKRFTTLDNAQNAQCAIVLGARVWGESPSPMLQDRLNMALRLYQEGIVPKILVSGDHGQEDYDEVNAMRLYLEERGVAHQDIFMDHAGFNTYATMYRARDVFEVESAIIVTQEYHLKRAVYIAARLGLNARGIPCDVYVPAKLPYYMAREWLARIKDFLYTEALKPKPQYLGEVIPITGDGDATRG